MKHHHITEYKAKSFRLRFLHDGTVFDRNYPTLEKALAARDYFLPPSRSCRITAAEHSRQLARLPACTDMRGIYIHSTGAGYSVRLTRNSTIHYGGFTRGVNALAEAVELRDALAAGAPPPLKPGRHKKLTGGKISYKTKPV